MSDPWKHPLPAGVIIKLIAPSLEIPRGGWTAAEFARQGPLLLRAMVRAQRIATKKAFPYVAAKATELFRRQLEAIIGKVMRRVGARSAKDPVTITIGLPANEEIWRQAIQEVLAEEGIQAALDLVPPIQSVMAQAYSRVTTLMGQAQTLAGNQRIAREAREVAARITRIHDTTREVLDRQVRQAIQEGLTVQETAARLRDVVPELNHARVNMITRTELSNAWQQGSLQSFQESETLTHVSVIGCESRERERWGQPSYQRYLYRGESTCNIQDVPIQDAGQLQFHPNHTGTLVPSRFRNADGTSADLGEDLPRG